MRPEIYEERIELRLTKRQLKKLQDNAKYEDLTVSQLLRNLIDKCYK